MPNARFAVVLLAVAGLAPTVRAQFYVVGSGFGSATGVSNNGLETETSTIDFPSITTSMDAVTPISITLADEVAPIPATFASCLADKVQSDYYIQSVKWTKPWTTTP